jgi:hypothetical protein
MSIALLVTACSDGDGLRGRLGEAMMARYYELFVGAA